MTSKRDYYEILGISKNSSKDEIKRAYKEMAKKYHPDVSKEPDASEKFKEISEAYAVLSDDNKKAAYNQFGHSGFDQRYSEEDIFRGFDSDVFNDIFGRSSGFESIFDMFFSGGSRGHSERRGQDLRYDLEINLKEAAFGTSKTITINKLEECNTCYGTGSQDGKLNRCDNCNGHGIISKTSRIAFGSFTTTTTCNKCRGAGKIIKNACISCNGSGLKKIKKEIEIEIPSGVDTGSHLRLKNEGNSIKDGSSGDLYIVIHVEDNEFFKRHGNNVHVKIPITFSQAALGTKLDVPTLDGNVEMKIPPGTQQGTIFRLRGKGIKNMEYDGRGDQLVEVNLTTPTRLSKRQQELFKDLEKEEEEPQKSFFSRLKESLK